MLQGLFFLQGRSGKLFNLGRGIYHQDENFACEFFTVAKKSAFREKKVWEKNVSQLHKELLDLFLKLGCCPSPVPNSSSNFFFFFL